MLNLNGLQKRAWNRFRLASDESVTFPKSMFEKPKKHALKDLKAHH